MSVLVELLAYCYYYDVIYYHFYCIIIIYLLLLLLMLIVLVLVELLNFPFVHSIWNDSFRVRIRLPCVLLTRFKNDVINNHVKM